MMKGGAVLHPNRGCCQCIRGGYVPLMLDVHHGAGVPPSSSQTVPRAVEMTKAKSILGGLSIQDGGKRKKYISI